MSRTTPEQMTEEERRGVLEAMADTRLDLIESIQSNRSSWSLKPNQQSWSIAEVVEHIVLSERSLFKRVETALSSPPNPDWLAETQGKMEFLRRVLPNRSRKAQAPDDLVPSGNLSVDEAIERYLDTRGRSEEFARTVDLPLKAHTASHPFPVFGVLNAYQWLAYIPLHNLRHNLQIREIIGNT